MLLNSDQGTGSAGSTKVKLRKKKQNSVARKATACKSEGFALSSVLDRSEKTGGTILFRKVYC